MFKACDFLDITEADFDAVLRVNLKGAFLVAQAVARDMARAGRGSIVNMSSVNGTLAIPSIASYNVSKGGINQLTRVMALALADQGIRVNAVAPGTIATELAAERLNLLETLAERVAERILAEPQAMRAFVRIEKLDVGPYKLGVEIVRSRAEAALKVVGQDGLEAAVHPLVIFLDNASLASADLSAKLDAWSATGLPVILTLGLPDLPRPQTGHKPTQRRVDLLAIEQNAWGLAARDPRCVVMQTRTEIDWAVKRRQMMVWAPSKMVLDATDGPQARDAVGLALWLAETMAADRLIVHGPVTLPAGSRVPVEQA